tara:strand:+ start:1122 stop:1307 length:186 start_codon:yes stop_codon:yes gene_type:complete
MATVFLKPKDEQTKVRNPANGDYLPAEGAVVELTSFWRRRLRDGDVVEAKPPKVTAVKGEK